MRIGIVVALSIAITATMDATGLTAFSALPLCPIMFAMWYLDKIPASRLGFVWSKLPYYMLAILYPLVVMSSLCVAAVLAGEMRISQIDWSKGWRNALLAAVGTILIALVTEEGFFRGWLWSALESRGSSKARVVITTAVLFAAWHISVVAFKTGFDVPVNQVPIFLGNALLLGVIWGIMRAMSGSIVVTSVSHGVWNGLAYELFGFGTKTGILGIHDTAKFGPEVGILGLAFNVAFAAVLWWTWSGVSASPDRGTPLARRRRYSIWST